MDDLGFIQRCLAQEEHAWSEFVKRYSRLIYSYIYSILKVKGTAFSREHINDIFQDFFLHLRCDNFKKLRSFQGRNGCTLASWLRQVAVHFTIDYLRKERLLVSLDEENEDGLSLKDLIKDSAPSSRDKVIQQERLKGLRDCIGILENADKFFLELHLYHNLDLDNLKEMLRLSRAAVDMRKHRILERLKDCFRKKGFLLD